MGKRDTELFDLLRANGVRRKVAKPIAALDGNGRRAGSRGEKLARQAMDDLSSAADDIRTRVLRVDRRRSQGSRKAAQTRRRVTTKRQTAAKKGAQTRKSTARARKSAKTASRKR